MKKLLLVISVFTGLLFTVSSCHDESETLSPAYPIALSAPQAAEVPTLPVNPSVSVEDNSFFTNHPYWRGADGGFTVKLKSGKVLWLFGDTLIDRDGTGDRENGRMIRNSIAIQQSNSLSAPILYAFQGTRKEPKSYFDTEGDSFFWPGNGIAIQDKLVIFLAEKEKLESGQGPRTKGWYVAIVNNPDANPNRWDIDYVQGTNTFGVLVGIGQLLDAGDYVYAYSAKDPRPHRTYLLRYKKEDLIKGELDNVEWWIDDEWKANVESEPISSALFGGGPMTYSVHYEEKYQKYIQVLVGGEGPSDLLYRSSDTPYGPWSKTVTLYEAPLYDTRLKIYGGRAHPEYTGDGLIVTYNTNSQALAKEEKDNGVWFPKIIRVNW